MFEVQEALETEKEEFARREELNKRREENLRKRDQDLQQSLIRFNKFLQENDAKRQRADKKAAEERKIRLQKEQEKVQLKQQLESLTREREKVQKKLGENEQYQRYLALVLEETEDFQEVSELLLRHETLVATNRDLKDKSALSAEETDRARSELQDLNKQLQDMKLRLHNEIAELQQELEEKEILSKQTGTTLEGKMKEDAHKMLRLGKIRMSVESIYERCVKKAKVKLPVKSTTKEQLKVIADYMVDLASIVKNPQAVKSRKAKALQ